MKIIKNLKTLFRLNSQQESIPEIKNVAIFGYADAQENDELFKSVVEVSRKLAEVGFVVVDGGGPGVMRAATVGAKEVGGRVIGVTWYPEGLDRFEGRDPKNLFDEEIKTSSYVERTLSLMEEGQVYVIFNGGTGTISEFGMAWGLARLYFGHHKPLILYGDFWESIMKVFKDNMLLRPEELKVYKIVNSPEEVIAAIEEFQKELKSDKSDNLKATKN